MTAQRLEIIAGSGRKVGHLILIPIKYQGIEVEGDFLSKGTYYMSLGKLKNIIKRKAEKYYKNYQIKYTRL